MEMAERITSWGLQHRSASSGTRYSTCRRRDLDDRIYPPAWKKLRQVVRRDDRSRPLRLSLFSGRACAVERAGGGSVGKNTDNLRSREQSQSRESGSERVRVNR